ncbi:MAG: dienelactone hydrolase family protein [Vampirovibrio sp.]|nr:dienelactone hydrolase family protein [Vampirovibrio sp.]
MVIKPKTQTWEAIDINGSSMETYVAIPEGTGPWPAVLVLMEIFGVNAHIRDVTEQLAKAGYVAATINYYHRSTPNLELGYTDRDVAVGRKHKDTTTMDGVMADLTAAVNYLKNRPDVSPKDAMGCVGFCYGGHLTYLAATLPEVKAAVSFYGAGVAETRPGGGAPTLEEVSKIHGKLLCLFGELDPLIPHSHTIQTVRALRDAEVEHEVVRYPDAGHGFFCNQRQDFHPFSAQDAWDRMTGLFQQELRAST